MGHPVTLVYLTTDDPLYLPTFFDRVLTARPDTAAVLVVPPLYRDQTAIAAAVRYLRTFGLRATCELAARTIAAKARRRSIRAICEEHGVSCCAVEDVNDTDVVDRLAKLGTDVLVSVSCPQIFRRPLIELPARGCLNVHGAILPEYRGVLPSFWMLANGEARAGVSVFFVNDTIDGGDLCGQRAFEIRAGESLDSLLRRSKAVAAELVLEVLDDIEAGTVARQPLEPGRGSYYSWPDRRAVRRFHAAGHRVW
jgi:methionyl-tRNA formyltransferase